MWQSPSSEHSSSLASQESPLILRKMKTISAFTRDTHVSVSWVRSIHSIPSTYLFHKYFNIILPSMSRASKLLLPLKFPTEPLYVPLLYRTRATCPALQFLLI